jgi:hypothetical protein
MFRFNCAEDIVDGFPGVEEILCVDVDGELDVGK